MTLGLWGLCKWFKADLGENQHTLGLPTVTTYHCPCPWCALRSDQLPTAFRSVSIRRPCPSRRSTYEQWCRACEVPVLVTTEEVRTLLLGRLEERGRPHGWGLTVARNVPALHLRIGDTLVPSAGLRTPKHLAFCRIPTTVMFWRRHFDVGRRCTDPVHRRNPAFSLPGFAPSSVLVADTLHTSYFGPFTRLISAILWRLVDANPWGVTGSVGHVRDVCVGKLRDHMITWCDNTHQPAENRLGDLQLGMLGPRDDHPHHGGGGMMSTKAVETARLLPWALQALDDFGAALPHRDLLRGAGYALLEWQGIVGESPMRMTQRQQERLLSVTQRFLTLASPAELSHPYKFHGLLEMALKSTHNNTNNDLL